MVNKPELPMSGIIKVDEHLCLECRECELACSLYHEDECNPHLSRIHVEFDDFIPEFPKIEICQQCDQPECYYACVSLYEDPALYIDPGTGARVIDEAKCTGCGACVEACPLMPEREIIGSREVKDKKVYYKCDLCKGREGGPICVAICPSGSLVFISARERIDLDG
jgi:carbon-monoxide dehydrogenase iron sulfur subunit